MLSSTGKWCRLKAGERSMLKRCKKVMLVQRRVQRRPSSLEIKSRPECTTSTRSAFHAIKQRKVGWFRDVHIVKAKYLEQKYKGP